MTSMLISPELEKLGVVKQLGCGHEGCVYTTTRDTVIKVAHGYNWRELATAQRLQTLAGKHKIIPRIFATGEVHETLTGMHTWVEREPLNDLQLTAEGEAEFSSDAGRLLDNAGGDLTELRFSKYTPARDKKLLSQLLIGFLWLKKRGIECNDHSAGDQWGLRADGAVVLRDLGHIFIIDETFDEFFPRES